MSSQCWYTISLVAVSISTLHTPMYRPDTFEGWLWVPNSQSNHRQQSIQFTFLLAVYVIVRNLFFFSFNLLVDAKENHLDDYILGIYAIDEDEETSPYLRKPYAPCGIISIRAMTWTIGNIWNTLIIQIGVTYLLRCILENNFEEPTPVRSQNCTYICTSTTFFNLCSLYRRKVFPSGHVSMLSKGTARCHHLRVG